MQAVIVFQQVVLENAFLNVPVMDDYLLFTFFFALPDHGVVTVFLNHEFSFGELVFDVSTVLDDDFLHFLDLHLVKLSKTFSSNGKSTSHKNIFSNLIAFSLFSIL